MISALNYVNLPDKRLNLRLREIVKKLSNAPGKSIPEVFEEWHEAKAAYRFMANERVEPEELIAGQQMASVEGLQEQGGKRVLLMQDTTSFDFSHHPKTTGMGPLENQYMSGFLAHSTLSVSEEGVPLGLWEQQVWVREADEVGKRHQRHKRPFEEKESYKWVEGLPDKLELAGVEQAISICDREAHIYEFLDRAIRQGVDFIVRASRGRSTTKEGEKLFQAVSKWSPRHQYTLELKRRPDRPAREAKIELRWGTLTLKAPRRSQAQHQTLTMQVVEVIEPNPPDGKTPVHWLLLTSLPIENLAQAQEIVRWYSYRWLIERFHYVLKSGCKIEDRQLRTQKRLRRLLAVFNLVAWRLLWLTYQSRKTPLASCLIALTPVEWQALYARHHRTTQLPDTPPSLVDATRWIAQLGGFLGRKGDGDPGVKVLWRGWVRLQDIVETWLLFQSPSQDVGNV